MLQHLLATAVIMVFLGVLLFSGLYGPPAGQKLGHAVADFFHQKTQVKQGALKETAATIQEFDQSIKTIRQLRGMVMQRNKENVDQLETAYKDVRENLRQLLTDLDKQTVAERDAMTTKFKGLHGQRKMLVQSIIEDERSLINLNDQMDQELKNITAWLSQQKFQDNLTRDELTRSQQFENLKKDLESFVEETNQLDVMRVLLVRKSKDYVNLLDANNAKLEENFANFNAQVETADSSQSETLWKEYESIEGQQREIVQGMRLNQEYIGENQQKIATGIATISKNIRYTTESQLDRFQQNYQQLQAQRQRALDGVASQQKVFLESVPTMQDLKQSNEYRMQQVKEQTHQILQQYEKIEDYRRTLSSTLSDMTNELTENDNFISRQIDDMNQNLKERTQNLRLADNTDAAQRIRDSVDRNLQRMEEMRSRMDSLNVRLDSVMTKMPEPFINNPYYIRLQDLRERNKQTMTLLQDGEDKMRAAQERQRMAMDALRDRLDSMRAQKDRINDTIDNQRAAMDSMKDRAGSLNDNKDGNLNTLKDRVADLDQRNKDSAQSIKDKTEDQKRTQRDRMDDLMQRLRDQQSSRY